MNLTNDSSKIPGKEQKKKYTNLSHLKQEQKNNNYTQSLKLVPVRSGNLSS